MHVLTWLRDQGHLTPAEEEGVVHHAQRTGQRIEEALIDSGVIAESDLLKLLAAQYQSRFVSTARLAKADIDRRTLELVPHKLAERLQVFPVVFDRQHQSLSVVVAAPGEDDAEKQIQVVSGIREVRAYVARPAAIRAAIAKHYEHDSRAFSLLAEREAYAPLDVYAPAPHTNESTFDDPFSGLMGPSTAEVPRSDVVRADVLRAQAARPLPMGTIPNDEPILESGRIEPEAYLETLNVCVSLLEQDRGELRGHSSQVAHLCRRIAERVGLSAADRHALLVAAYLHDVGKGAQGYHLTPLNVARYEGHRLQANKSRETPARLFASAQLPDGARKALAHLYERVDGQGFPDRLTGKDIPYGARVLAIVETYCDLVGNPRNPYRKVLSVPQALSVLKELSGTLFDPTLADLLRHLAVGDGEQSGRNRALIVDPDPEETTVLEMRLIEHGFAVTVVRDLAAARAALADLPNVIVSEVDLERPGEGFELATGLGELAEDERPEVIFLTTRADRESVSKGFDLGAADYLVKPASAEVVATKAGQALAGATRRSAAGVSGSLKEMSLPDVVQILANGRRGGRLSIVAGGKRGEIHFAEGQIHDAQLGSLGGEEAFYALLKFTDGTFALDPSFVPTRRAIHTSPEGLLLEGMRRLDEGLV